MPAEKLVRNGAAALLNSKNCIEIGLTCAVRHGIACGCCHTGKPVGAAHGRHQEMWTAFSMAREHNAITRPLEGLGKRAVAIR